MRYPQPPSPRHAEDREAIAAVLRQLAGVNDRLHLASSDALELVADDAVLVHLEQRRIGFPPRSVTSAMAPNRLLAVLESMGRSLGLPTPTTSEPRA